MILSPRTAVASAVLATLAVCALAIAFALSAPATGLALAPAGDGAAGLVVTRATGPAAAAGLAVGDHVTTLVAGDQRINARAELLVEDPDGIPDWAGYRFLMAAQSQLVAALESDAGLVLELADGSQRQLQAAERHLSDLPAMFWLQLLFGAGGMLTGALVMAARPLDRATQLYFLTGLGFLVFSPAAAVYSTREVFLDGTLFRFLSQANHFGALLFTASLTSLVWSYPLRLGRLPVVSLCFVAAIAAFAADHWQLSADNTLSPTTTLLIFMLSFVFAGMQWWQTRNAPAERAALRWFLLSIYLATGLFAGTILVPTALGMPPLMSQGVMFGAFLLMYWGLALGVTRYRLFSIDRWWRSIWWWFIGGVAVVVLDIALVSMLALSEALALSLAVAIVGWLYFPLRQWLWTRADAPRERTLAQWLPDVLPMIIETQPGTSLESQIRDRWPRILAAVFRPLAIDIVDGEIAVAALRENGLAMAVPDVRNPGQYLLLRHADSGSRLFSHNDLRTLDALRELFSLALDRLRARDAGARLERERIRRDVHDDLGAKLLTLLHTAGPDSQPLVREAIDDLRILVRALEFDTQPLRDVADGWQAEARKRCEAAGVTLLWRGEQFPAGLQLNARQLANLTRVVREAISNALKHARPTRISVELHVDQGRLQLLIGNDGQVAPLAEWREGRGRQILLNRVTELGGKAAWQVDDTGCRLTVEIPL